MKGDRTYQKMWNEAQKAAARASVKVTPTPMIVQQHASPLDDGSPVVKEWFVKGGVCGFGWVEVRPANSKFANWLKRRDIGRYSSYSRCIHLSAPGMTQSMTRNEAAARAMAEVLVTELAAIGEIKTEVSAHSRID